MEATIEKYTVDRKSQTCKQVITAFRVSLNYSFTFKPILWGRYADHDVTSITCSLEIEQEGGYA